MELLGLVNVPAQLRLGQGGHSLQIHADRLSIAPSDAEDAKGREAARSRREVKQLHRMEVTKGRVLRNPADGRDGPPEDHEIADLDVGRPQQLGRAEILTKHAGLEEAVLLDCQREVMRLPLVESER